MTQTSMGDGVSSLWFSTSNLQVLFEGWDDLAPSCTFLRGKQYLVGAAQVRYCVAYELLWMDIYPCAGVFLFHRLCFYNERSRSLVAVVGKNRE